jgi:sugar phosphate isomerase/epimerase
VLKNLTIECFRGLVRQNELIEIGLTHHFDAIDVDINDMQERAAAMGMKFACQLIKSAGIPIACFELPLDVAAEPERYDAQRARLESIIDLAKEIRASRCRLEIPATGDRAYHETFELVRGRIAALAEPFAAAGISIGLMLQNDLSQRRGDYQFVQKADELLTLIKLVGQRNVGIALDTCSWTLAGGTIAMLHKVAAPQWVDVQLCDPAPEATLATADATVRCLPSAEDDAPSIELVRYLHELGYEGPIAATAHPSRIGQAKPAAIGARLAEVLNEILAKADSARTTVGAES